jgi:acetylornithine deacetylase/succinyl-diaminopimelate desuccinylase-like protein
MQPRALLILLVNLTILHGQTSSRELIEQRLRLAGGTNAERAEKLRKLFAEEDCTVAEQLAVRGSPPNLICTLPGSTQETILVGAHFDAIKGMGVADNWSGAALLATLYREIKALGPKHTFVFVGFTDEEKGLLGSRQFVNQMSLEQRKNTKAVVNIDTLGLDVTNVWIGRADKDLSYLAAIAASEVNAHLSATELSGAGTTDSESFEGTGIPRITFSSVRPASMKLLHGKKDNFDAIQWDHYYASVRLLTRFLTRLDVR